MRKLRLIHHFKACVVAVVVLLAAGALGGVYWLNDRGFKGEWAERITAELTRRGIHADFQSVRFSPTRGIITRRVVVYSDESRQRVFARIPRLRFEVDRIKALRGDLVIRRVIMHEADLFLPVSSDGQERVEFKNVTGNASIDREDRFVLRDAHGTLGGMRFNLEVELDEFDLAAMSSEPKPAQAAKRDEFVTGLLLESTRWSFPDTMIPQLDLRITGSLKRRTSIRTSFAISAAELSRHDYNMEDVLFSGELRGRTLSIDRMQFSDGLGELIGKAAYDLEDKTGRYDLESSIKISDLLRKALGNHSMDEVVSAQAPRITGNGRFEFGAEGFKIGAIGKLALPRFSFLGHPFVGLTTDFSWQDGDIFLRNLAVEHEHGLLTGQVLMQADTIQYEATSTFPIAVYRPFLKPGTGIDKAISRSQFYEDSKVHIKAEGTIRRSNLKEWTSRGEAVFDGLVYNGVPLLGASADFDINPLDSVFTKVNAVFDYTHYPLRRRHGGSLSALVQADRIHHDQTEKLVHISNLRGKAWPGPVLRLFVPRTADYIEKTYGLHAMPNFAATGVVDGVRPGQRTDITSRVRADGVVNYEFLDRTLQLEEISARIRTRYQRNEINDLEFRTLGGSGGGNVSVRNPPGRAATYSGGIRWTDLTLAEVGRKYGFEKVEKGVITGRLDFTGSSGSTRDLNGKGVIGLRNGQLFYVPIFGPLSAPIGGVLGHKKFSHEKARDASATFVVKNGVAFTNDFLTSTTSTVFTGEGKIDLLTKNLDMTVRMNARGLLGLVTLPLRPFNGLFQFRGQGPLAKPVWRSSPFTQPPRGKNDPIFRAPGRAQVVPEP